jgi:hypothetical protein
MKTGAGPQSLQADIPFRVRVGVVSDIPPVFGKGLADRIRGALRDEIFARGSSSKVFDLFDEDSRRKIELSPGTPLAFSLLTTLVGPTDRLVAEEFLKQPRARIEAVLPATKEEFVQSFIPAEYAEQFESLIKESRRPVTPGPAQQEPAADAQKAARAAYRATAQYIVDHCDLLICVLGGDATASPVAETAGYARQRGRPIISILPSEPVEVTVERGHGLSARSISGVERFNSFPMTEADEGHYVRNVYGGLFKEGDGLPAEMKRRAKEVLLPHYARASTMAKRSQRLYRRAGLLVYCFSAAAVASVATGTLVHALSPYAFALELLLLLAILALVIFADRRRAHKNWIESRFLAERIRASVFLMAGGAEVSRIHVPPYLGGPIERDDWMNIVFDEIWNRLPPMNGCEEKHRDAVIKFIRERWTKDQIQYHDDKENESERKNRWLERGGIITFGLALAAAASHLGLFFSGHEAEAVTAEKILTFIAITLPAVGAAAGGIRAHREYSRLSKRSRNMAVNLKRLDDRFSRAAGGEQLAQLLRETEELILVETEDWLMLMSSAKVEVGA